MLIRQPWSGWRAHRKPTWIDDMCAKRRATARLIRSDDWLEVRQLAACKAVGAAASGAELNLSVKKLFQPRRMIGGRYGCGQGDASKNPQPGEDAMKSSSASLLKIDGAGSHIWSCRAGSIYKSCDLRCACCGLAVHEQCADALSHRSYPHCIYRKSQSPARPQTSAEPRRAIPR